MFLAGGLPALACLALLAALYSPALFAQEETKEAPPAAAAEAAPAEAAPAAEAANEPAAEPAPAAAEEPKAEEAPKEEEAAPAVTLTAGDVKIMSDTMWVMVTAMLVFFMNLGFAAVESGMCRAKNTVNILSKNFIVFAVTSIGFLLLGWGIMFGNGNPFMGTSGLWMVGGADNSPATGSDYVGDYASISWTGVPLWAKFFFQLVFAGTAATIVSGAVAERIKYPTFIVFSFIMAIAIYPVVGHWIWGGGWLASSWNFFDFAGSTQVHSIGGWAALTGAAILGPRIGKYGKDGKVNAIPGHSLMAATIGCFILWFGWFGFNPGSTMAMDVNAVAEIAVTTNTAAAAAALSATLVCWIIMGKPDLGMTLNGCLAGLVAITAPCAFVTVGASLIIGLVAGALVVLAVIGFDKLKIDDPVGATSVHLVNGVFGTLCVGLFAEPTRVAARCLAPANEWSGLFYGGGFDQLIGQSVGVGATAIYVLTLSSVAWFALKYTMGLRVSEAEELEGLDIGEHGQYAYPPSLVTEGFGAGTAPLAPHTEPGVVGKPSVSPVS
jgi:Amt family ammonium transporter